MGKWQKKVYGHSAQIITIPAHPPAVSQTPGLENKS